MAKKHTHESVDTNIESLSKAEAFITKHNKKIIAGVIVLVLIVSAIIVWKYLAEKEKAESKESFVSIERTYYSAADSLTYAASLAELEQYISKYEENTVEIAHFDAGVAAYNAKDFEKAVEHFSKYNSNDAIFNARKLACLGDCYAELQNYEKALENYSAAVYAADNYLASEYAFKAGIVAEKLGNNEKALEMYKIIKDKYSDSPRGKEIDKYISRVEAK